MTIAVDLGREATNKQSSNSTDPDEKPDIVYKSNRLEVYGLLAKGKQLFIFLNLLLRI